MQKHALTKWLVAVSLMLGSCAVNAAGLGAVTVLSSLGEPFRAEIDLVSVKREELSTLSVRLAAPDAYQQAGLNYTGAVAALTVKVEKQANGRPYVKVASTRSVNELALDLLLDVTWPSGRLLREYRVAIDLPEVGPPPNVAQSQPDAATTASRSNRAEIDRQSTTMR